MSAQEPNSARLVFTLAIAGLLSGLGIVFVYDLTLPSITAYQARVLREAIFEVVPGASAMQPLELREGALVPVTGEESSAGSIFAAYDPGGGFLGYAIPGEGPGFQDTIRLLFGFDPERRTVIGMQVLESRETPGLGDKIFKDANFLESFRALATEPEIRLVKSGTRTEANEVDGITGATISSKAVVKIVREGSSTWYPLLPPPGAEPALPVPESTPDSPGHAYVPVATDEGA